MGQSNLFTLWSLGACWSRLPYVTLFRAWNISLHPFPPLSLSLSLSLSLLLLLQVLANQRLPENQRYPDAIVVTYLFAPLIHQWLVTYSCTLQSFCSGNTILALCPLQSKLYQQIQFVLFKILPVGLCLHVHHGLPSLLPDPIVKILLVLPQDKPISFNSYQTVSYDRCLQ